MRRVGRAILAAPAALVSQRLLPLWVTAGGLWALFAAFRAALLVLSRQYLEGISAGDLARCFLVGLRYDAFPIAIGMIPLAAALSLAPNLAFERRAFRRAVTVYAAVLWALAALVEAAGVAFYLEFGARLNWIVFDYLGHFRETAAHIWSRYPVWALPAVLLGAFFGAYLLLHRAFWAGRFPRGPIWPRPLLAAALIGPCVIGIRGGFAPHPLRFGAAYFTHNHAVSQAALNGFFTLYHAADGMLKDSRDLVEHFPFPPAEEAFGTAREMLFGAADAPAEAKDNPLWRRTSTGRAQRDWNVVVIVMESMAGRPVGALGYGASHTPRLDAICREGVFFDRLYAVDERTSRGLVAVLCGHPDLGGFSLMKRSRAQGNFLTLPEVFRRRGYRTLFIYGGDPDFDNMAGFFGAGGVETIVGLDQMDRSGPATEWGMHDEVSLRKAHETFVSLGRQKFFAAILTISNHQPFDVPAGRTELLPAETLENRRLNGYRYADWALGDFFDRAAGAEYFRRTVFVLVADHGRDFDRSQLFDAHGYRVPCVIYAPGLVAPRRVATVASQTDIAPTLLALLGGQYEHGFLGRDLLSAAPGEGFALLRQDDRLAVVQGEQVLVLPPDRPPVLFRLTRESMEELPADPAAVETMRHRALSYLSSARHLYFRNAYRFPSR